jgi:hypothetical protein
LKDLQISIAPLLNRHVEYFKEIELPILITNSCSQPVLIESITLRFQTDEGMSDYFVKADCAQEIKPFGLLEYKLLVSPTPELLAMSNEFDVRTKYKKLVNNVPGELLTDRSPGTYLVIESSSHKLGQLFISFKQPEDGRFARILKRVAERAGFTAYIAMDDPTPSMDIWDRIEPNLRRSVAIAFVWTDHTEFGDGVEREIRLSTSLGLKHVLLIQEDLEPPIAFRNSGIEYQRFDPSDPLKDFSLAIMGIRKNLLRSVPLLA